MNGITSSSMSKLSPEEKEIESIDLNFPMAFGQMITPFSKMRLNNSSKTSFVVINKVTIIPSLKAHTLALTSHITKGEVDVALNFMKPYKVPGPDGFHCIFFKLYWHIVGEDIFQLVKLAFLRGYFDPSLTDTLVALIPKTEPPTTYNDFRLISLCNIIYKIITKVLVLQLRPIMDTIIGPYQGSFLPGRDTTDNVVVLQEINHHMRRSKKKKGYVAFKLDLEKVSITSTGLFSNLVYMNLVFRTLQ